MSATRRTVAESVSCSVLSTLCNPMDCTHQAPLSMGFLRQEYWSGVPFRLPGDLPDPGIEPPSPSLQAAAKHPTVHRTGHKE